MGQYHLIVNLGKRQYLSPTDFDDGLKLTEFGNSKGGVLKALASLLLAGKKTSKKSWAGDPLVVTGDYGDKGKFVPAEWAELNLYQYVIQGGKTATEKAYKRITKNKLKTVFTTPASEGLTGAAWLKETTEIVHDIDELAARVEVEPEESLTVSVQKIINNALYWSYVAGLSRRPLANKLRNADIVSAECDFDVTGTRIETVRATLAIDDDELHTLTWTFPLKIEDFKKSLGILD